MGQKNKRRLRLRRERLFRATEQCKNCGDEFANHEYVKDSITQYKCPHPHQEPGYGYGYRGLNPHQYHPDYECCHPDEIQRWKDACETVERGEVYAGGYSWGIGTYVIEFDQFFAPREHNYERSGDDCRRHNNPGVR
jgi:hypothetical protein